MSDSILGIDFGTTNTAAVFFDKEGKLRLVKTADKSFLLPSVVWFHSAERAIVGHAARTQIVDDPRHTVFGSKRFLGRRFNSEYVARYRDRFAFPLVEGDDGYTAVSMYDRSVPLTEVVQFVIRQIVALANETAGKPFEECVLTVPAHASIRQREAVRAAAALAGISVRAMINEPTAAALYYANLRNPEQTVFVLDLGGGTLDCTLMSVKNRMVQVLATGGDAFLGGSNFDEAIAERLGSEFHREHGVDPTANKIVSQRLVFAAESAKIALSTAEETKLRVPCIGQRPDGSFIDLDATLTRAQIERDTFALIERTAAAVDDVLQRSGITAQQVDELVLVGGQTRMPGIRHRFQDFKRFSSEKDVHPDLGVAIGAAVLGRNLARGTSGLSDVVPIAISLMLPGGRTLEAIRANTPVPCKKTVALGELPRWSAPVPIALLEALDRTSVEREMLGSIAVPPQFRNGAQGPPSLELSVGQDFALGARLVAPGCEPLPVPIVEAPRPRLT